MTFHSASKQLIYDISNLIFDLWDIDLAVREYVQKNDLNRIS
jgi:hypothetical protein